MFTTISINSIINTSINERKQVLEMINNIFPDIEEYINLENFEKHVGEVLKINTIEEVSDRFTGENLIESLLINATQQFCFWVDPKNQAKRILKSSDFYDLNFLEAQKVIEESVTLRKNRVDILNRCLELRGMMHLSNIGFYINDIIFNKDFFKKKKNLYFMLLWRYRTQLGFAPKEDYINNINPAVDYQIPKILNLLGIINYPQDIKDKILNGELIIKDSRDELFIRSLTYKALILIQASYGHLGINQINLDTYFWYNRNNFGTMNHHCTITDDY